MSKEIWIDNMMTAYFSNQPQARNLLDQYFEYARKLTPSVIYPASRFASRVRSKFAGTVAGGMLGYAASYLFQCGDSAYNICFVFGAAEILMKIIERSEQQDLNVEKSSNITELTNALRTSQNPYNTLVEKLGLIKNKNFNNNVAEGISTGAALVGTFFYAPIRPVVGLVTGLIVGEAVASTTEKCGRTRLSR